MVFNRKPDSTSPEFPPLETKRPERPQFASVQMGHAAAPTSNSGPSATSTGEVESVIGNDLSIEGQAITIRCKGSLIVNGNIQADLHSKRLKVGKEAVINGAIAADTVNVYGRVNGAILGSKVVLHNGADVEGDIMSQLLSVEEGANFDGRSRRVKNPADIAPQLEPSSLSSSPLSPYASSSGLQFN
jgi:cytoskeletal protein CcmA (bactofilin family)